MFEQEAIKIFDGLLPETVLTDHPVVKQGEKLHLSKVKHTTSIDKALVDTTFDIILKYRTLNIQMGEKWKEGTGDCGFLITNPFPEAPHYVTQREINGRAIFTIVYFTGSTREIHFPLQGMKIRGTKGRAVVFPSYSTHPYSLLGEGAVIITHISFPDREGNIHIEDDV